MATRSPIRPLSQDATQVRANAAAEKARKLASKAALAEATAVLLAAARDEKHPPKPATPPAPKPDHSAEDRANAIAAQRVDWEALGSVGTFEDYLREQGFEPDGAPDKTVAKTPYSGPMLALVAARKAYVKAKNGIQCNGDKLAMICGAYTREQTVAALTLALTKAALISGNPYTHLNPGQQSMNLRNKTRHAVSNGFVSFAAIEAAYAEVTKAE